jgi:hypothetical protein
MQDNHFEAASYGIGHTIGLIERGPARLRHDGAIEGGDAGLAGRGDKPAEYHRLSFERARRVVTPILRIPVHDSELASGSAIFGKKRIRIRCL